MKVTSPCRLTRLQTRMQQAHATRRRDAFTRGRLGKDASTGVLSVESGFGYSDHLLSLATKDGARIVLLLFVCTSVKVVYYELCIGCIMCVCVRVCIRCYCQSLLLVIHAFSPHYYLIFVSVTF